MNDPAAQNFDQTLVGILTEAIAHSNLSKREVARKSGVHKDALLSILNAKRPASVQEAMSIFDATGMEPRTAIVLALIGEDELNLQWAATEMHPFLAGLISALPRALLGEDIVEVKERWGAGTARMIAKALAGHIAELTRRETAFGLH